MGKQEDISCFFLMVKYGSIERQYMTGGVGMIQVTLIIRITLVLLLSCLRLLGVARHSNRENSQERPCLRFSVSSFTHRYLMGASIASLIYQII